VPTSARIKTDKTDAATLAHLLRTNLLPKAHLASSEARLSRELAPRWWEKTLSHPNRFVKRATLSIMMTRPKTASATTCGQRTSRPLPFRKIPRTMVRK